MNQESLFSFRNALLDKLLEEGVNRQDAYRVVASDLFEQTIFFVVDFMRISSKELKEWRLEKLVLNYKESNLMPYIQLNNSPTSLLKRRVYNIFSDVFFSIQFLFGSKKSMVLFASCSNDLCKSQMKLGYHKFANYRKISKAYSSIKINKSTPEVRLFFSKILDEISLIFSQCFDVEKETKIAFHEAFVEAFSCYDLHVDRLNIFAKNYKMDNNLVTNIANKRIERVLAFCATKNNVKSIRFEHGGGLIFFPVKITALYEGMLIDYYYVRKKSFITEEFEREIKFFFPGFQILEKTPLEGDEGTSFMC